MKILAINGSYRSNGFTDQVLYQLASKLQEEGAEVEQIDLRDYTIEFCYNCRECTQVISDTAVQCVQQDDMAELIVKIEQADGYILASPTNIGSVTALFKRFMERLVVYLYWPWDKQGPPQVRKQHTRKKPALLVTSGSAPIFISRWTSTTRKELTTTAKVIGAKVTGIVDTGLIATRPFPSVNKKMQKRIQKAAHKLIREGKRLTNTEQY